MGTHADEGGADAAGHRARSATRSPLRDSLMRNGSRSTFWEANQLTPSKPPAKVPAPPPFFTEQPVSHHPGNSKALAVFWDLDRFDVGGDHEQCTYAVDAVRTFCKQFVGLSGARTRDALQLKGYCGGLQGRQDKPDPPRADAAPGVPENAGRRAGVRAAHDNVGLRELAIANLVPNLSIADKHPHGPQDPGDAALRESPQLLADLLVWMLDCVKHRLFVPTAIVISDDPSVAAALSQLAERGAYTILLTSNDMPDRVRGSIQVVLPFQQVCGAHMPLGNPPLRVIDHTLKAEAAAPVAETNPPGTSSPRRVSATPSRLSSAIAATPTRPARPATSPANTATSRQRRTPSAAATPPPAPTRRSLPRAEDSNAALAPSSHNARPVSAVSTRARSAGRVHGDMPPTYPAAQAGDRSHAVAAAEAAPGTAEPTPKDAGAGDSSAPGGDVDECGAKMWCLWSKQSVFEVGEAVSVKRSDGRYTLGVVVGLGAGGHYSSIHDLELTAGEVEILCDFESISGQRITRVNRIEKVGKFPATRPASPRQTPSSRLEERMGGKLSSYAFTERSSTASLPDGHQTSTHAQVRLSCAWRGRAVVL
eukprot:Tamp_09314.p1 GENE.Tamp_09314~~Tamp_09314.p1  ORF type:complete len:594 (-),score=77.65 Tamp_09314:381-2162(-)